MPVDPPGEVYGRFDTTVRDQSVAERMSILNPLLYPPPPTDPEFEILALRMLDRLAEPMVDAFTQLGALSGATGGLQVFSAAFYGGIQQAIDAANTAGGGIVFVPAGNYTLSNRLRLYSKTKLLGVGPKATRLNFTNNNADGIYGEDWEYVTIEGMSIIGPGDTAGGTGCGIKAVVTGATGRNALDYVTIRNVFVDEWPVDGVSLDTPIVSHLDTVISHHAGRHAFNIYSDQADINGTSTTLTNCYAAGAKAAGFRFHRMSYCNVIGAASDANGISYWVYGCKSITFTAPGSETPYWQDATYNGRTVYVYGSWGIVFVAPWFINNIGVCIDIAGESHVSLFNPFEGSPGNADSSNNNPTHWLRVAVDCEVTVVDEQVVTTATSIDPGAIVRFSSAWGLKDRPGAWTANQEFQGTLYVSGTGTLLVEGATDFASGLTVSAGTTSVQSLLAASGIQGASIYTPGALTVEGNATFTGAQVNVPTPTADGRAANKGYVDQVPINARSGADYTLALTDAGGIVEMSTAHKVRIPTDAAVNFPINTVIQVRMTGTSNVIVDAVTPGTTTVVSTAGSDPTLTAQWTSMVLQKRAANTWVAEGAIS